MTSQSAESDYSFATFPIPQNYEFEHNQWIPRTMSTSQTSCIDTIIGDIKREHDQLRHENANLTAALQRSYQENVKLLRTLQRKEQDLQADQRCIEKLEREIYMMRGVAKQMQDWEGRLAACERMIPMYQQPCKEIIQPTRMSNADPRTREQRHAPRLRRSGPSTTWKVDFPPSQQSPGQVQQPAVEQKSPLE